jgi:AraC family transcriptional regulator
MSDNCSATTRRLLFESLGISVVDFRCHAPLEPLGSEEPNPTHSIVFIRRGAFGRSHEDEALIADPNHVLFFNATQPYRYSHPIPGGDDCTILAVETPQALDLVVRHGAQDASPEAPFRRSHALSSRHAVRLHWELLALLEQPVPKLALQDTLAELADEAVCCAYRSTEAAKGRGTRSAQARRRRRELSEAAKVGLNKRLETPPTLAELAHNLGCSPFHLSRTFHATLGLSLREYLKRLRARVAAERLAAGVLDLSELALDLGYADHSHFTNSFRHEWGISPSRFRSTRRRARSYKR